MIIIAWNGTGSIAFIFVGSVFKKVLSIFITSAILRLIQGNPLLFFCRGLASVILFIKDAELYIMAFGTLTAVVNAGLSFKAWRSMKYLDILWYVMKVLVALAWVIALPICYAHSWGDSNGLMSTLQNWVGWSQSPSLYMSAVLIYLFPDAVSAFLFLFPVLRRITEQSELTIVKVVLWWSQVSI